MILLTIQRGHTESNVIRETFVQGHLATFKPIELQDMRKLLYLIFLLWYGEATAQSDSSVFQIDLEFRPRFEYRDGYKSLPADTSKAAAFVSNRTRLKLTYERPKFLFHASVQDIRVWGQYGLKSVDKGFGMFEAYVQPQLGKHLFLRIGRQAVELDNGRLLSASNWNQTSKAHEGINLMYKSEKLHTELMTFYNQSGEQIFGTSYSLAGSNYTSLTVHYLNWKIKPALELMTLNIFDVHESTTMKGFLYLRGTSGGRITYTGKTFAATLAGYYQYGQLSTSKHVDAYYIQPEVSWTHKWFKVLAGTEWVSGDRNNAVNTTNSFETLYGVTFKFMGNLDQFTSFPNDVSGYGLIDPYLFFQFSATKKLKFKWENHAFFTEQPLAAAISTSTQQFLGLESDLKFKYTFNSYINMEGGIAYMEPTSSFGALRGVTDYSSPFWGFLMVKFDPNLLYLKMPVKHRKQVTP